MQMFRFSMSCKRKHLATCYMASKLQHLLQRACNSLSWIYSSTPRISSQSLCHLFCDETISVAFVTPRTDAVCRHLTASTTTCASQNTVLTIATVLWEKKAAPCWDDRDARRRSKAGLLSDWIRGCSMMLGPSSINKYVLQFKTHLCLVRGNLWSAKHNGSRSHQRPDLQMASREQSLSFLTFKTSFSSHEVFPSEVKKEP